MYNTVLALTSGYFIIRPDHFSNRSITSPVNKLLGEGVHFKLHLHSTLWPTCLVLKTELGLNFGYRAGA